MVIGAGFSGTTVAINLLRAAPATVERVFLVERADRNVGGVAYQTPSASHTLNVPAGRMSAFEDDPDHFLRYVRLREPALTGGSFVPRRLYGEYLADTLEQARRESALPLIRVSGEVVAVDERSDGVALTLGDGRVLTADQALLAIGNYPPSNPPVSDEAFFTSIRYAGDPWARDALEMDRREDVLLIGTGLTMCDVALALRDADHRGRMVAVSRRGLLPQAHRVSAKPPPHLDRPATIDDWPDTALGILRGLREEVRERAREGVDWREVVTSVRHDTPALWQRLDAGERRRFLRHLRPYWETHRHRSSPETALAVEELVEAGRLEIVAGCIERLTEDAGAVVVTLRRRGPAEPETIGVAQYTYSRGPPPHPRGVGPPLSGARPRHGLVRPDELGLGLGSDAEGRLLTADGQASRRLSLVGPLRKGQLWENTAVPELRVEARRMAERLADGPTR